MFRFRTKTPPQDPVDPPAPPSARLPWRFWVGFGLAWSVVYVGVIWSTLRVVHNLNHPLFNG
jgi:hypothetical protein